MHTNPVTVLIGDKPIRASKESAKWCIGVIEQLWRVREFNIIADEVQNVGTVDQAPVYPREIVRRALELAASNIILVHNHPSGDPTPSAADLAITRDIIAAAKPLGVTIHDHLVIGRNGAASFKSLGLI